MIDIIIPAYNAHDTIIKTLINLRLQTFINKAKIYVINDCSINNYQKEINYFCDDLNIMELKTPFNMGPGAARQYALDRTSGKYIVFLDADDQLYNPYTLSKLFKEIDEKKLDLVMGDEIIEDRGLNVDNSGSLHGKIYRRSFIEKNNIRFNNTRYSEDDSFNKLIINLSKKVKKINLISYLYLNNPSSITSNNDKKVRILMMYIYNMIWTCLELKKRNVQNEKIAKILLNAYTYVYKHFKENNNTNYHIIYEKCYRLEELFSEYEKYIKNVSLINKIRNMVYCGIDDSKKILKQFNEFRNKFGMKNNKIDIIIPAYNAHSYIKNALDSIAVQTICDKLNVYIINDCSTKNYNDIVKKYDWLLNIKELKTPKNLGPCGARQYGINHSTGKYIVFLDADDVFNNGLSLKDLYFFMEENKCDVGKSNFIEETPKGLLFHDSNANWMHGKIYNREFLEKNKIKFNNIEYYGEYGFNQLISLVTSVYEINSYTYIWKYNQDSMTRRDHGYYYIYAFKDLIANEIWAIKEAEKRKCNLYILYNYVYNEMFGLFYRYLIAKEYEQKINILTWSKNLRILFIKYKSKISPQESNSKCKEMMNRIINSINESEILNIDISFNEFLDRIDQI